jgi:hypothetical protein
MVLLQAVEGVVACFHLATGEQSFLGIGDRFAFFRVHNFFDVLYENLKLELVFKNAGGLNFSNVIDNNTH